MPRLHGLRPLGIAFGWVAVLGLAALGLLLITDNPGLRTEYFGLVEPWEGRPLRTTIGQPQVKNVEEVRSVLLREHLFSIRWSGWWLVTEGGRHRFTLAADNHGYFHVDGKPVVERRAGSRRKRAVGSVKLEPGLHAVEIGLAQVEGDSHLELLWRSPGRPKAEAMRLPPERLYARRPMAPRRAVREALASWPRTCRQLLGAALILGVVMLLPWLSPPFAGVAARCRAARDRLDGRALRVALLVLLFVAAFLASWPFTGTVRGGDDTAYLAAATFGEKAWFFNRYAHVYLLRSFVALSGWDPFAGVRMWWSFVFAGTVAALAVAVRSVGPGLQLRTLAATLFVLLAQGTLLGMIGAGFADYSAMLFITAAVAVYLHGIGRAGDLPPPRVDFHALALGALTVAAFRSKEVGAVLLILPALLLIENGHVDLRRFGRRMAFWAAGAGGVLLLLMLLDGWVLGELFFTLDGGRLQRSASMNFPDGVRPRKDYSNWWQVVWFSSGHPASLALRNLWVGVVMAAIAAGLRRCRIELRLLHLLPIAFLLALMVLYIRMPHPFSSRMLIPILPVASLMVGLLLYHAGLEEISWKHLLAPRLLIPLGVAAALVFLVAVPYRMGRLDVADLLPMEVLSRYGWQPDLLFTGTLFPIASLVTLSLVALFVGHREARIVALLVACLAFFGLGFEFNRTILAQRNSVQRGEIILYPWTVFSEELEAARPTTIVLSTDVHSRYQMSAATRSMRAALAALALGRRDVHVELTRDLPIDADVAIASRYIYNKWRRQMPALETTERYDPSGLLVFMRPKAALRGEASPSGP